MKGVIFSAVQSAIERNFGDATWDQIIDDAGLSGAYTSLGNYDDAELVAIITGAPDDTGEGLAERLRWFGKESVPFLVEAFPEFFEGKLLLDFLPSLNHIIHPEVRKLYPGSTPPDFDLFDEGTDSLTLRYTSERQLCFLAEGFTFGVAAHTGETVEISQPVCMHEGGDHCELRIDVRR